MSKSKVKASVDTNDNNAEAVNVDEPFRWEDLRLHREEAATDIIKHQVLIMELSKQHEKVINNDNDLFQAIKGLVLSMKDLADELNDISKSHATFKDNKVVEYRTGEIEANSDEEIEYSRIVSLYITLEEKIANLISVGSIDIFTRLKMDRKMIDQLNTIKKEGNDMIKTELDKLKGK